MSDQLMNLRLLAKVGAVLQHLLNTGALSAKALADINEASEHAATALTWLTSALAEAKAIAATDPMIAPEAWLDDVQTCLRSLSGAVNMLVATGITTGLGAAKTHDLGWLETLLEQQAAETRVLQQIVKISG